jgi:hypothetical protein
LGAEVLEVLIWKFRRFWSKVPEVPVVLVRKFWRLWSESSGGCGPKVMEVLVQKFWMFWFGGWEVLEFPVLEVGKLGGWEVLESRRLGSSGVSSLFFFKFGSQSSRSSGLEVLEVPVRKFRRFQSKSSRSSSLDVLEIPARKFSRFQSGSSGGSVTKVPDVPVRKFWITSTDYHSEFFVEFQEQAVAEF